MIVMVGALERGGHHHWLIAYGQGLECTGERVRAKQMSLKSVREGSNKINETKKRRNKERAGT